MGLDVQICASIWQIQFGVGPSRAGFCLEGQKKRDGMLESYYQKSSLVSFLLFPGFICSEDQ